MRRQGHVNLRQWVKFLLRRDTTFSGEFTAMVRLAGADCPRSFVDVGANDGFYGSNSYPFAVRGWRCVLVEPHPEAFTRLQQRHRGRSNVSCHALACGAVAGRMRLWTGENRDTTHATLAPEARAAEGRPWGVEAVEVEVVRLDRLLRSAGIPERFGILSIDTEGWDLEVLRGLDLAVWRPRLIITEDMEPGLAEKCALLSAHGYERRLRIDANSLWTTGP